MIVDKRPFTPSRIKFLAFSVSFLPDAFCGYALRKAIENNRGTGAFYRKYFRTSFCDPPKLCSPMELPVYDGRIGQG